jgi:hypothetical protein
MSLDMLAMAIPDEEEHRFPWEIVERAFASIARDVKDIEYRLFPKSEKKHPHACRWGTKIWFCISG